MVVDFLRLGGFPSCRPTPLSEWCNANGCPPITEARRCFPLEFPGAVEGCPGERAEPCRLARAIDNLGGAPILDDAPDESVVIRAVAVAESCDEVAAGGSTFARERLMGCSYSCPVVLDEVEGEIFLDLESGLQPCSPNVEVCATDQLLRSRAQ
jgi:hypothetical protein